MRPPGEGDALISDRPGVIVGVKTADCVPILLVDPSTRVVAAIQQAGAERRTNIAAAAVRALAARWKIRPGNLRAAIGPSIGVCCYEVGPEVARRFGDRTHPSARYIWICRPSMRCSCGPPAFRTSGNPGNAHSALPDRFYSFRREREQAGRMLSFIGLAETRRADLIRIRPETRQTFVKSYLVKPRWRTSRPNPRPRSRADRPAPGT